MTSVTSSCAPRSGAGPPGPATSSGSKGRPSPSREESGTGADEAAGRLRGAGPVHAAEEAR
eukprot:CAMPEP_0185195416 /NCGR_PEP_ID=MMETSP1140-20130426/34493_1 /TAXON_ID=298111 /ORGANISM="Pavlova sp., Strain CCMP459" /LENGTH=60 /DNA_ID=CAMNT_0027762391 /DNA_START=68 /DNA_END=247 /DNA_ORIENTATION=-